VKLPIRKLLVVFATAWLITAPFIGWWKALILAVFAALDMSATEGGAGRKWFSRQASLSHLVSGFKSLGSILLRSTRLYYVVLTLFLLLPFVLNRYQTEIVTLALIYVTLAIGLNYIVGLCGMLALGYIAFYAIGAYTYALLNAHFGMNLFVALPISMAMGGLAGLLVSLPALRLRGDYLAIVTLGFGEIVRIVLNNWDSVTAGPNGIMGIARPSLFGIKLGTPLGYYLLAGGMAALAMFVQARLIKSRTGRAWEAIREDQLAAAHSGVPVFKMKLLAMALGAAWAGAAGALFASRQTHISPESFTFLESVLVLCMVVLGGMGSVWGPALGALGLILIPEFLRGVELYRMLAFGLLMVWMMHFRRGGLIPSLRLKTTSRAT